MKSSNALSVIIPFHNEEKTLSEVLRKVLSRPEVLEIVLVDDGSSDKSVLSIKSFIKIKRIKLIQHKVNCGKGKAIISGLKKTTGKTVLIQDADSELSPSDYPKLLKPLLEGKADFVIGNRWKNKQGKFWFKAGNRTLTLLLNLLFGLQIKDLYCGYKVGTREVWQSLKLSSNRFEIEPEIIAKLALSKARIANVDIRYIDPRGYKEGKHIVLADALKGLVMLLRVWAKSNISRF